MSITHHFFRLHYGAQKRVKIASTPETEAMGIANCWGVVKKDTPKECTVYVMDPKTRMHKLYTLKRGWLPR
jgi:hypothetical protein